MNLFPRISAPKDCGDQFDANSHSFPILNSLDLLVSPIEPNHIPGLDPISGTSSNEGSPELPDYHGAYLSYIHDILMEEEDSDDTPAALPDYGALKATEKSFYEALSESNPSSSDQNQSIDGQSADVRDDDSMAARSGVDSNNWILYGQLSDLEYSSGSNSRNLCSSSGFEDDSGGRQNREERNSITTERRTRRVRERDNGSDCLDLRNSKLLASYEDEDTEVIEQYEYILLRKDQNDADSDQRRSDSKGEGEKGSRRRGSRSKKESGSVVEMVDLRTLLSLCAQSVANFDIRAADDLLKQIREHSSPYGDSIQRVAHYFANGLEARMAGTASDLYFNIINSQTSPSGVLKCYQRYTSAIPVNRISFFLANQTIARLAETATQLHIIDFGIYHGFQWPSLIQQLSEGPNGPPKLRITGIDYPVDGFRPAEKVEQTGRRLQVYCDRFNVPFEYHAIAQIWETIVPEDIKIESGELVVVNSHYRSSTLMDETDDVNCPRDGFLRLIRKLNPDLFIHGIVNGSYNAPFFITRFRESLLNFISIFDMIGATMPREDPERKLIEQDLHGKEILNLVASEGSERVVRPETYKQWQVRTIRAGFRKQSLHRDFLSRAKDIVKLNYHKDFVVDEDNHWMLQGWKGRILFGISCWKPL